MRNIIFALTATALVASAAMVGCSSSTTTVPKEDMATGKPDMTELPPDMTVVKLGCVGYQSCIITCLDTMPGAGEPMPTYASCEPMCNPLTKSGSTTTSSNTQAKEFFTWLQCTQDYCTTMGGESDAGTPTGTGACALNAAMTEYTDAPGQPQGACQACLGNAVAAVFLIDCTDPNSPDCNPAGCATQAAACNADTP